MTTQDIFFPGAIVVKETKDIQQLLSHLARFSNCMMSWCDMQGERQDDGRIDADGRFH
jgi:hypothetical protein